MAYLAISFAPVQSFIEKSRKLRDLYGASLILSYLTQKLIQGKPPNCTLISPGCPNLQEGMPNRILLTGHWPPDEIRACLLQAWQQMLNECQTWIAKHIPLPHNAPYDYNTWDEAWQLWRQNAWEVFSGEGDSPATAMDALEQTKLSRDWIAPNWFGESSSLSGTDAIAWPGMVGTHINPRTYPNSKERKAIATFYQQLAAVLEGKKPEEDPQGKFLTPDERLSIPELVKRLVTYESIAQNIGMTTLRDLAQAAGRGPHQAGFTEIVRRPKDTGGKGQWTAWFMGDGDRVGEHLKTLAAAPDGDRRLQEFSEAMRTWGKTFQQNFDPQLGRIVYAGGDDFLGVLYHPQFPHHCITGLQAWQWFQTLPGLWASHGQPLTVSVGFIWAAPSVPQRDVLQHCREAEQRAKKLGRDRATVRVLFNNGQFVQWTCPWQYLGLLNHYGDRNGGKNWTHVYTDWHHLKTRRTIDLNAPDGSEQVTQSLPMALHFFDLYFPHSVWHGDWLDTHRSELVGEESDQALTQWIEDLIQVGWYLQREEKQAPP